MDNVPARFKFHAEPRAHPDAVVIEGHARFTVLAPRCIRMEYAPGGSFEDRASLMVWFRRQPVPEFKVVRSRGRVTITTTALKLVYDARKGGDFVPASLRVVLRGSRHAWSYGEVSRGNLGGTFRTLDGARGPVTLDEGLFSTRGWHVVDDSGSVVFNEACWVEPRRAPDGQKDLYFFGFGHDFKGGLQTFCALAGTMPLVPRWALGNWWSRYWAYTATELHDLICQFRQRGIPLSVCIIDMDWHVVKNDHTHGWTGYTWSAAHFPDPKGFLARLHREFGLKIALNLHPRDGVHPHEDAYPRLAAFMGIDPEGMQPVPFDISDVRFADGYFKFLHHPHEKIGVDFWWMDWQQGQQCAIEGLDPLFMLNHLHFLDLKRDGCKRPFIFSRWHGLGNHRYPIGFSGDTVVCWASLQAQPHSTATAANVGCSWWSHDIGGHYFGSEDPELYIRWIQFGVLSPILRMHAFKNRFADRTPWGNGPEAEAVCASALRLRHQLVPYLYSMAERTRRDSLPLVRPMYWEHPQCKEAYYTHKQYYFGTELIAAPFTEPRDRGTRLSRQAVWLPAGDWYHFFSGERFAGNRWQAYYGTIEDLPLFAKAGAIVPMRGDGEDRNGVDPPVHVRVRCFAGAAGRFELYEDDGTTPAGARGAFRTTVITMRNKAPSLEIRVAPPEGDLCVTPAPREWTFEVMGVDPVATVVVRAGRQIEPPGWDVRHNALRVRVVADKASGPIDFVVSGAEAPVRERNETLRKQRIARLMKGFDAPVMEIDHAYSVLFEHTGSVHDLGKLAGAFTPSQNRFLAEILLEAGLDLVKNARTKPNLVLWNNRRNPRIRYRATLSHAAMRHDAGVPKSLNIETGEPPPWTDALVISDWGPWSVQLDYAGVLKVTAQGDGHHGPSDVV